MRCGLMVLVGLVSCGDKALPSQDQGVETPPGDTGGTQSVPTGSTGLRVDVAVDGGTESIDECAHVCIVVTVTEGGEPVKDAEVDLWIDNDCVGPDLVTDTSGWAQVCLSNIEVGTREVVAVVGTSSESGEGSQVLEVEPFGYADGIARGTTVDLTLPFTPSFERHALNPVLAPGMDGAWDQAGVLLPSMAKTEAGWMMWYSGTPDLDYSIGAATSEDGWVWTKATETGLVPTGEDGSWRRYATNSPMLVQVGVDWRVYFTGRGDETGDLNIGMAMVDGPTIVDLYPANPVFEWSETEVEWGGNAVAHPAIIHHPDGQLEMWYSTGLHRIGYAYSLDGVDWKRHCKNPIFEGDGTGWDQGSVKSAEVVWHNGWYMMSYTGGGRGDFKIGWAMSRNGLDWVRASEPVLAPVSVPGTWESSSVLGGALVVEGDTLRMAYSGTGATGSSIGLATADLDGLESER